MSAKKEKVLQVTVKQQGFRRAGRSWSGTTQLALDELSKEQIEQLKADSMFIVETVEIDSGE